MLDGEVMLMVIAVVVEGGRGLVGGVSVSKMSPRSPTDTVLRSVAGNNRFKHV